MTARRWVFALGLTTLMLNSPVSSAEPPSGPVLLELFSSEGCSSCPPADALLRKIAADGLPGTSVIALEWHVDYWNDLGWADPFSSPVATERQHAYARQLRTRSIYTPQLVVDGVAELVGGDEPRLRDEGAHAASRPHALISLALLADGRVRISSSQSPAGAALLLAVTEEGLTTAVQRGENSGRTLAHGPVVRWFQPVRVDGTKALDVIQAVPLQDGWRRDRLHLVAWLQRDDGAVLGAAQIALTHP
jgi:hypothetical protein